jgi:hypothetical protein
MGTTYQDSGGGAGHIVIITRNVPPKRVMVTPGNHINYGGKDYYGQGVYPVAGGKPGETRMVTENDTFLCGEGPVADQWAFAGQAVVLEHDAVEAWNGEEGDKIRKDALAALDAEHKARGEERLHDHGFVKYEHADTDNPIPMDITAARQQLAQKHLMEGRAATDEDFGGKKGGSK